MFGLVNRGELPGTVENEFEHLTVRLQKLWLKEHYEDGTHRTDLWEFSASAITSGALDKDRQHAQTAYLDATNVFSATGNEFAEILSVEKGLQFPATQVASADVNALDDYEEGTWTPILYFNLDDTDMGYALQEGYYVKVGKVVHLTGRVTLNAKGTASGSASIGGLPFTSVSNPTCMLDPVGGFALLTGATGLVYSGGTLFFTHHNGAAGRAILTQANFTAATDFIFTIDLQVP